MSGGGREKAILRCLAMAGNSVCRHMASGAEDGSVALWDLDTMACERTCTHMDGGVKTVSISHDSQYVAYAGEQDYLVMESIQGGKCAERQPYQDSQSYLLSDTGSCKDA